MNKTQKPLDYDRVQRESATRVAIAQEAKKPLKCLGGRAYSIRNGETVDTYTGERVEL